MDASIKKINNRIELVYSEEDAEKLAEVILRVHDSLRLHYTVNDTILIIVAAHGTMSLTVHCMRAAIELKEWHNNITGLACMLARKSYGNLVKGGT